MNHFITACLTALILTSNAWSEEPIPARRVISLDGQWQVAEGAITGRPGQFEHTVQVPGVLISARPPFASVQTRQSEGMFGAVPSKRPSMSNAYWYRRTIRLDGPLPDVAVLRIKKARWGVKAWVNGSEAGEYMRVRTPGVFDVRNHLRGNGVENEILLRVGATPHEVPPDIPAWSGWTGSAPGLYDSVKLELCSSPHVVRVQAVPNVDNQSVKLVVTLRNATGGPKSAQLAARIVEDKGGVVAGAVEGRCLVPANAEADAELNVAISDCKLWSPASPFLYRFEIAVRESGRPTDLFTDRFGMRAFRISQETGRGLLNGAPILLRGAGVLNVVDFFEHPLCDDKPWREEWVRRALRNIKDLNGNAARFAFDHPPELWYRLADEEGILIQDEAHSGISSLVTVKALTAEFTDWIHERANHPCVVIWDASNETTPKGSRGRLIEAIANVRRLDRANRPWDNSWEPTHVTGDVSFEPHPYLGWRPTHSQSSFPLGAKGSFWAGEDQRLSLASLQPGFIINEYCGTFLKADGTPSKFTRKFFHAFLTPDTGARDRVHVRARFSAMETEYWRRVPGICGLMINPYLHGSGRHYIGDIEKPEIEPEFARFMRDAYAPISVMVDHWETVVAPGATLTVPVSIANDSDRPWNGEVRLSLLRAGRNLSKSSVFCATPSDDNSFKQATLKTWCHALDTVAVSQQRSHNFTIIVPAVRGNYQLVAEIAGPNGAPVRSWRDFSAGK